MENKITIALLAILVIGVVHSHLIIGRDLAQRKIFRSHTDGEAAIPKQTPIRQTKSVWRELLRGKLAKILARGAKNPTYKGSTGKY